MESLKLDEGKAKKEIEQADSSRREFTKRYFMLMWKTRCTMIWLLIPSILPLRTLVQLLSNGVFSRNKNQTSNEKREDTIQF